METNNDVACMWTMLHLYIIIMTDGCHAAPNPDSRTLLGVRNLKKGVESSLPFTKLPKVTFYLPLLDHLPRLTFLVGNIMFLLIAIWLLSTPKLGCSASGEVDPGDVIPSPIACMNCTLCQSLCYAPAPPPPSGDPSYETPPLPTPTYEAPPLLPPPPPPPPPIPTPTPELPAQGNCPTIPVVQCCQYPPPTTYGYVPYDNYSASSPNSPMFLFPSMMSVFSYAVLF